MIEVETRKPGIHDLTPDAAESDLKRRLLHTIQEGRFPPPASALMRLDALLSQAIEKKRKFPKLHLQGSAKNE